MELYYIYTSSDIIWINKSEIMTKAAQVTCAEEMRKSYIVSVEKSKVKCCLEDLDVNGRVVLKWILKKRAGGGGIDLSVLGHEW
jgi:hypothetical protein